MEGNSFNIQFALSLSIFCLLIIIYLFILREIICCLDIMSFSFKHIDLLLVHDLSHYLLYENRKSS